MTAERRPRGYALRLDPEGCGTVLGTLAWVMGALEIMKDRGHASGDEQWHALSDELMPKLERLVTEIAGARMAAGDDPEREAAVEQAYARIREAFEGWIHVTAADTVAAALDHRQLHEQADEDTPPDAPPSS
jgi:hypothetical protein